jgi:hypothetical protein
MLCRENVELLFSWKELRETSRCFSLLHYPTMMDFVSFFAKKSQDINKSQPILLKPS